MASYNSSKFLLKSKRIVLQQSLRLLAESLPEADPRPLPYVNEAVCNNSLRLHDMDLDVRCSRVRKLASIYLISFDFYVL